MEPEESERRAEAIRLVTKLLRVEFEECEQERIAERLVQIFGHNQFFDDMYYSEREFTPAEIVDRAFAWAPTEAPATAEDASPIVEAIRNALRALQANDRRAAVIEAKRALELAPGHPVATQILRAAQR